MRLLCYTLYLFFVNVAFCISQNDFNLSAIPESHPGAVDGKIIATIVNLKATPPPYIFRLQERDGKTIEIRDTTGRATFKHLGYKYYCITIIAGDSCQANDCFQFDEPSKDPCFTADISREAYSICQREKIKVLEENILNNACDKSSVNELIRIASAPLTNDSIKVEIIHFFRKFPCDTCISFLINHIGDMFLYGDGISSIDQFNQYAAFGVLGIIASDRNKQWDVMHPLLNSLRRERKYDFSSIRRLAWILQDITSNKEIAKSILEMQLENAVHVSRNLRNYIYEDNLKSMLKHFE